MSSISLVRGGAVAQSMGQINAVQIFKNLNAIALPAIALAASMGVPKVDAGPITYGICVAGCIAINPAWTALCPVMCLPAVGAPGP